LPVVKLWLERVRLWNFRRF